MREWLTVIIVLLIAGILLDGVRRMRQSRRENIKMSSDKVDEIDDVEAEASNSEFPTGGARVAGYRDEDDASYLKDVFRQNYLESKKTVAVQREPEQVDMNLEFAGESGIEPPAQDPALGDLNVADDFDLDGLSKPRARARDPETEPPPNVISEPRQQPKPARSVSTSSPGSSSSASTASSGSGEAEDYQEDEYNEDEHEVIIINVMAPQGYVFEGELLLKALTAQGMRFGHMDIFHRHQSDDGRGGILFSMANMVKPGTFDLSDMESFCTPGVCLFLNLPIESDSLAAFRVMTKIAKALAADLGGELKDENRSVMTQQTIEHCRQRVIEFDRKQRLARV